MSDNAITVDITLGGEELLAQSIVKGLNKITITTPDTLVDNKLVIDGVGANIKEVVVTNTDRDFGYFEGMKSVGECEDLEVVSCNKNLLNIIEYKTWGGTNWNVDFKGFTQDGNIANQTAMRCNKILKPNTVYTLSFQWRNDDTEIYHRWIRLKFHTLDGALYRDSITNLGFDPNCVSHYNLFRYNSNEPEFIPQAVSFTTPNIPLVLTGVGTSKCELKINSTQLEEGSTATDYIPHAHNTQTLTHEPLRAVGDTKDRYVMIDNKWYIERNVGLLDCTKIGVWNKGDEGEFNRYGFLNDIKTEFSNDILNHCKFSCNTYPVGKVSDEFKGLRQVSIYNHGDDLKGQIRIVEPSCNTVEEFYTYIQNNPTYVAYPKNTTYEEIDYNPFEVYADVTHISTNSAIPTNIIVKNHGYNLVALKENTQYTLYVNKDTTNALTYRLGDYVEINSLSKFTFTTPSTLTDKTLRIDGKGIKVKDLMLIEGSPINDSIGYFDGLKSSYECEQVTDENDVNYGKYKVTAKVVGKNLFNAKAITNYFYQVNNGITPSCSSNGEVILNGTAENIYDFRVLSGNNIGGNISNNKPLYKYIHSLPNGTSLTISNDLGFESYWALFRNGKTTYHKGTINIQIGDLVNCFIRIPSGTTLNNQVIHIQIEEGDTATEYEPYFESKQTIYLNSPLLKGDEIVWKDNKIQHYHKMKAVVLDGSNDEINRSSVSNTDCVRYYIKTKDIKPTNTNNTNFINIYSDKFITGISSEKLHIKNIEGVSSTWDKYITVSILKSKLSSQDKVGFRQWLQQNPIKVTYELETPYYEEISDYPLKLNVIANSSLSTESTIQVTNISFNIYEETLPYLYPNTKYYITFNADVDRNNIIINLGGNHIVLDCKVGFNKVEITTPSDTTNLLTFSGTGVNIDHVKVTQQDIDEYFEGMKSVGECEELEVVSRNKNLFDMNKLVEGLASQNRLISYENGILSYINGTVRDIVHNFDPYGDIYVQFEHMGNIEGNCNIGIEVFLEDNRKLYLMNGQNIGLINVQWLNDGTKIKQISWIYANSGKNSVRNILVSQTPITSFVPHQSNSQQLTHEPLRAVGNVKDRYVLIDGKWYIERNINKLKVNNEKFINVTFGDVIGGYSKWFSEDLDCLVSNPSIWIYSDRNNFICDTYLSIPDWNIKDNVFIEENKICLIIPSIYNDENIHEYINSLNIIYQLKTPVYEPLDYNPFETYSGVTHISTNSLIPTNIVVKNHGYNCILKPSTKYTVALNKPNGTISAKLGGSAKVDSTNSIFTITTPSTLNDNVLRLSGSGNVKDIMILEGDKTVNTPSYFEGIESVFEQEYDTEKGKYRVTAKVEGDGKESSIIFYINEPLRGTDTAKDRVFIQDGKVVVQRNCGSAIFDGSDDEGWSLDFSQDLSKTRRFNTTVSLTNMISKRNTSISDTFPSLNNIFDMSYDGECVSNYDNKCIYLRIYRSKANDVDSLKQWLQQNPLKVVYQLAEPTYEEVDCDLSKLVLENYSNSSLIFESNIPVSANIKYSGEVPVVTQAKSLSSQVDNTTLDINENIIPYMCDIDYRIVELQLMNGDTQGEGIELLGIGDIEILGNENVLFNNREDKKYNYSYDMLKRDILSQRYSKEEYQYRLDRYLLANKISDEEYKELEGLLNNGE